MSKNIYAKEALLGIPHILSVMDRNAPSPTYGCFYRPYWHDKATDIPSAHPQMCTMPLALVYKFKFPGSPYFRKSKVMEWAVAGMDFWRDIQKSDGSFDEHYPNEHSFGAAAWTLYAILESYLLLKDEMKDSESILNSMAKAAKFLSRNDEPGKITNHQVIAAYCLQKMHSLTGEERFLRAAEKKLQTTLSRQSSEGWFLEYDGCDLGYLTTTISFLAKIYRDTQRKDILESARKAIDFSSYFVYPNGFYGGVIGSRHTTHFHPHGYEILGQHVPAASAVSDRIIYGLKNGAGLAPRTMDQKYLPNLVIEFLISYLDFSTKRQKTKLPCDGKPFEKYFPDSGMLAANKGYYFVANMKKGGVFQVFRGKKSAMDSGISAMSGGKAIISGWLDNSYDIRCGGGKLHVAGNFHEMPADYLSSGKMMLSRAYLSTVGSQGSFYTKKLLIGRLITKNKKHNARFERDILLGKDCIRVADRIYDRVENAAINSVLAPRYVPASRYFHVHELDSRDEPFEDGIMREIDAKTLAVKKI